MTSTNVLAFIKSWTKYYNNHTSHVTIPPRSLGRLQEISDEKITNLSKIYHFFQENSRSF